MSSLALRQRFRVVPFRGKSIRNVSILERRLCGVEIDSELEHREWALDGNVYGRDREWDLKTEVG